MELAQIGRTLERVFEALVGLVDAHRPLHGHTLRSRTLGRKAIGMGFFLQSLPALGQLGRVLGKLFGHAKQRKVIGLQIHSERVQQDDGNAARCPVNLAWQ